MRQGFTRIGQALRLALALVLAAVALQALAQAPVRESAVKAAYLYKFGSFVEWPAGTFARPDTPLVIGVLGDEEIAAELEQIANGRTVDGRPVTVRRLPEAGAPGAGLHILFIGERKDNRLKELIDAVTGPVLVVTEQPGALRLGSMLNFLEDGGRIRFSASIATSEARNLRLSSRLLAVAYTVEGRTR